MLSGLISGLLLVAGSPGPSGADTLDGSGWMNSEESSSPAAMEYYAAIGIEGKEGPLTNGPM